MMPIRMCCVSLCLTFIYARCLLLGSFFLALPKCAEVLALNADSSKYLSSPKYDSGLGGSWRKMKV